MFPVPGVLTFVLLVLVVASFYIRHRSSRLIKLGNKLNGPRSLPILGNIFDFGPVWLPLCQKFRRALQLYHPYKHAPCRQWFGNKLLVSLHKAEHIQVLANSDELEKSSLYEFGKEILGNGLLGSTGELWLKQAKVMKPVFNSKRMETFVHHFGQCTKSMLERLANEDGGKEFDMGHQLDLCTLEISCETMFGAHAEEEEASSFLNAIFEFETLLVERAIRPWLYPDFIFALTSFGKRYYKATEATDSMLQRLFDAANSMECNDSLLDLTTSDSSPVVKYLLDARDAGATTHQLVLDEIKTFVLAGQETTGITAGFAVFLLAKHPAIQAKAVMEQQEIFGDSDRLPTMRELGRMSYLERVIKETMRLYPPTPYYGRQLAKDMDIEGHTIPAGAEIGVFTVFLHRRDDYYPEPLKFDPDRFLPKNLAKRHRYTYCPFGIGRRSCIGQGYAMMELKAILSMLLREYVLLPGSKTDIEDDLTVILLLRPASGIRIRIKKR